MSNVLIDRQKIDILANAISDKSGVPVTMTLDEMVEAVDGIETASEPVLQVKTYTVDSAGTETITADSGYDGLSEVEVSVPEAVPYVYYGTQYVTQNNSRKWQVRGICGIDDEGKDHSGYIGLGDYYGSWSTYNAVPANTTVTPTESSQTIGGKNTMMEGAVTVNAIPSNYVGSGITQRSSSDLTASGATVTVPSGYYASDATKTVASGSLGSYTSSNNTKTSSYFIVTKTYPDFREGYFSSMPDQTAQLALENKSCTPSQSEQIITPSNINCYLNSVTVSAIPSGTAGTPTATKGTVNNYSVSVTPSVTNTTGYITGGTKTGTAVSVSASELVSGTYTVTSSGTHDITNYKNISVDALTLPTTLSNGASGTVIAEISLPNGINRYLQIPKGYNGTSSYYEFTVPNGTAGTPTATKGSVNNHTISVTPSVTNTTGYITGSTINGTAVTVSASELVSGSETITENGTVNVTNLAEVVVNVGGDEPSAINVDTKTVTNTTTSYIQFTSLASIPTSFVITSEDDISTSAATIVSAVVMDGTSLHGQGIGSQVTYISSGAFTPTYNNGTLRIDVSGAQFATGSDYKLVYTYGGSTSDIHTADVQVGSGATSITFAVSGNPSYWSCIFKSDFSTSSGYQRVIAVANDGSSIYGLDMDSSAHAATSWSATYSGGNLTISSQGTNNGGYFHQPGYYQLTYIVDDSAPSYQTKTVTPTSSQQIVTPDSGYDALEQVTVNAIPSSYVQPTSTVGTTTYRASTSSQTIASGTYHSAAATIAAVSQTNLTAANIKSGTTVTISNGQSNLWSVTGTYSGDGGGSVNIDTKTVTASNYPVSISFSSMQGEPKAFFLRSTSQISSSGSTTYYYIINMRYNGTNTTGNCFRIGSTRQVNNITSGYSWSYSGTTLTITSSASSRSASPGAFNNGYELVYIY